MFVEMTKLYSKTIFILFLVINTTTFDLSISSNHSKNEEKLKTYNEISSLQKKEDNVSGKDNDEKEITPEIERAKGNALISSENYENIGVSRILLRSLQSTYPTNLDWRYKDSNVITSVKRHVNLNDHWAFTTIALIESFKKKTKNIINDIDLSEQFLITCISTNNNIQNAIDFIHKNGFSYESQFPYPLHPLNTSTNELCTKNLEALGGQRESKYDVDDNFIIKMLQNGPLSVVVSSEGWNYYGKGSMGILSCPEFAVVDHSVLLIGYTSNAYIIKNSWGTNWGNEGFGFISRSPSQNCRITKEVHWISIFENNLRNLIILGLVLSLLNI